MWIKLPTRFTAAEMDTGSYMFFDEFPLFHEDIWVDQYHQHYVFKNNLGETVMARTLFPRFEHMTFLFTGSSSGLICWQEGLKCLYPANTEATKWIYMKECPYPGYVPTSDDEYWEGSIDNLQHGSEFVFTPAGIANGEKTLAVSWHEEPFIMDDDDGVFRNSSEERTFGFPYWAFSIFGGKYEVIKTYGKLSVERLSGSEDFYFSDDGLTLYCSGWERQMKWTCSSIPESGADHTYIWQKIDPEYEYEEENINIAFLGWYIPDLSQTKKTKFYIGEIVTWH